MCMRKLLLSAAVFAIFGAQLCADASPRPDQIVAVNRKAQTITVYEGPNRSITYSLSASTRVLINGQPGGADQLKPGMKASVNHAAGSNAADLIDAKKPVRHHRR